MSLNHNPPFRIREFRHLFAGNRRIVATIRVDLAGLHFRPGIMSWIRCEWGGAKVKQPDAELYSEFKAWADFVFSDLVTKIGSNLLSFSSYQNPQGESRLGSMRAIAIHGCSRHGRIPLNARSQRCSPGCPRKTGRTNHVDGLLHTARPDRGKSPLSSQRRFLLVVLRVRF